MRSASPVPQASPSAELRARVLGAARAEAALPRSSGAGRRGLVVLGGVFLSVAILFSIGGPGGYGRPSRYYLTLAALWLAIGVVAAWAGVARGRSMLGRPAATRMLVVALVPLALVATALVAGVATSPVIKDTGLLEHMRCVMFTVVMAVGPLAAFLFIRRGSDPVAPAITGAAIGTAAGAIGALGIELRCSHAGLFHVFVGHVLPVAALALVGALVASRVVAVRSMALAPRSRR